MKLTNLPGGLKMSQGPNGQPRLNAVSIAPRVRVGKNLKLWLGDQAQNWSLTGLTHQLASGDWSSDPITENKEFMTTSQQSRLNWPPIISFSI